MATAGESWLHKNSWQPNTTNHPLTHHYELLQRLSHHSLPNHHQPHLVTLVGGFNPIINPYSQPLIKPSLTTTTTTTTSGYHHHRCFQDHDVIRRGGRRGRMWSLSIRRYEAHGSHEAAQQQLARLGRNWHHWVLIQSHEVKIMVVIWRYWWLSYV